MTKGKHYGSRVSKYAIVHLGLNISSSTLNCGYKHYSLFMFSWPRFESESLRNGGMLILRIYFAVDGMPIEMYGESWIASLLTSDDVLLYMAGFETTQGI